jgi:hypothetical protein
LALIGDSWILKVGDTLLTLQDANPSRNVNQSSNVTVTEIITCILDSSVVAALKSATSLSLQYYSEPIAIPEEGIIAIKKFLNE